MKKLILFFAFVASLALPAFAQNTSTFGTINASASNCTARSCVYMEVPILGQTSVPGPAPWITVTVAGTWSGTLQVVSISSPTATYQNLNSQTWTQISTITANGNWSIATGSATFLLVQAQTWNSGSATVTLNASSTGTPLSNPVFSGQLTGNGLAAPNGGSNNDCWPTNGGPGISCAGAGGIGDQIQEFGPFTAQCGTSNGYALMNSAAVATLPAYTEKCLIPFSAVGAGTVASIVSGSTNIFNECPPAGLFSSVSLASPQTFRVWSNGTNWEASCPFGSPVFNVKQSCGHPAAVRLTTQLLSTPA